MKDIKKSTIIASIVYIIAGLILLIFPTLTAKIIAYTVATVALVFGLFEICAYFFSSPEAQHKGLMIGLFSVAIAIFIYCAGDTVLAIIPIILGFTIMLSGIATMQHTMDLVRIREKGWLPMLIVAAVNIILGILCVANPFKSATTLMCLIGIGLLFSGISDIVAALYLGDKKQTF